MLLVSIILASILAVPTPKANKRIERAVKHGAKQFTNFISGPGECRDLADRLPAGAPSTNLAALWIRAVFHDAGTFTASTKTGGADGSLLTFQHEAINAGLLGSLATSFVGGYVNLSKADTISLAGAVTVTICGGPVISFQAGRIDTVVPTRPDGLIPEADESFSQIVSKLNRMGLYNEDIVALVTGSHTMGYFLLMKWSTWCHITETDQCAIPAL